MAQRYKKKALDQLSERLRALHYSRRTEEAYRAWIKRFIFFHGKRHPSQMGAPEIEEFLTHLAIHEIVAASTQNQALSALLSLYRHVLRIAQDGAWDAVRARKPKPLPIVLTRDEVNQVLNELSNVSRKIA